MPNSSSAATQARAGVPACLLASGVTFLVLAAGGGRPAWSRDEAATVMIVRRPAGQVWSVWASDPALEPYYLAMNGWAALSTEAWWLRLPSMLAMAAAAGLLVSLTTRLSTRTIGLSAGLLFALLPAVSRYGTEARPYAASVLCATLLVWAWTRLHVPRRSTGVLAESVLTGSVMTVAVIGAGLMHAYALLLIPVLLAVSLAWGRLPRVSAGSDGPAPVNGTRRVGLISLISMSVGLLALIPFLLVVARGARGTPVAPDLGVQALLIEVARWPVGILRPPLAPLAAASLLMLAAAGAAVGLRGAGTRRVAVLALSWAAAPPLALCLLQAVSEAPGLVARYWTFCLPGLALAASPAVVWCLDRSRAAASGILLVLLVGTGPTQVALRGADGHAGLGAAVLSRIADSPDLRVAAILVDGSSYRTLVAERPGLIARMPLVVDPAPEGLILPRTHRANSVDGRRLLAPYDTVLVLQNSLQDADNLPRPSDFTAARAALRSYSHASVLCAWFGERLGVFERPGGPNIPDGRAQRSAAVLETLESAAGQGADCIVPAG